MTCGKCINVIKVQANQNQNQDQVTFGARDLTFILWRSLSETQDIPANIIVRLLQTLKILSKYLIDLTQRTN